MFTWRLVGFVQHINVQADCPTVTKLLMVLIKSFTDSKGKLREREKNFLRSFAWSTTGCIVSDARNQCVDLYMYPTLIVKKIAGNFKIHTFINKGMQIDLITFSNVKFWNKNSARHHHSKLVFKFFLKLRCNAVASKDSDYVYTYTFSSMRK